MDKKYIFLSILLLLSIKGLDANITKNESFPVKTEDTSHQISKENTIFKAVKANDKIKVLELIESGIDPNTTNEIGQTPLHIVCEENKNLDIAKILVEHGANINVKDINGQTPLSEAILGYESIKTSSDQDAKNNKDKVQELIKYLLSKGADINTRDAYGFNMLHKALFMHTGSEDLIKMLIDNGIDVNASLEIDDNLITPLMLAIGSGYSESTIKYLINHGANDYGFKIPSIEATDFLYDITKSSLLLPMIDSVKILIKAGIDPNAITSDGKTALDGALKSAESFSDKAIEEIINLEYKEIMKNIKSDKEEIVKYLKAIGAKTSNELLNKE